MKYNELKEMKVKDWDGEPFDAYYTDNPDAIIDGATTEILGYVQGKWLSGPEWNHVYPVEWNKDKVKEALFPKPKRMTNRQLAMWLAKGNGEYSRANYVTIFNNLSYLRGDQDRKVCEEIRVRKWDSKEWIEPTVDLLEDCK